MYSDDQVKSTLGRAAQELGYSKLHPQQEIAVQMFVQGRDVFMGLPTGSGKSLCYTILPTVFDILRGNSGRALVVVVSQLIALMKDQVRAMTERNVTAVYLGDLSGDEALGKVCSGEY